ncbi:lytic transglycosylase domain-containing protein [Rhizobium leguminosarum]|uniref:lytic transglycosylase domain-containing protein n=1 Tax=Rhizobium leguminosarum TaxID=384 RepID=UPI0021BC1DAF|nr:transglycosylase SLT domain-containing protein [Rhizobium leguminosarum]
MDRIPLSPVRRPQKAWSRSALWTAGISTLLLTGFASGPDDNDPHAGSRMSVQGVFGSRATSPKVAKLEAEPAPSAASSETTPAQRLAFPSIDWASFNQRFDGPNDAAPISNAISSDEIEKFDNSRAEIPGEAAGTANARRERTVHSPISVFSFDQRPAPPIIDPAVESQVDTGRSLPRPRPDLLSNTPEKYARLAVTIAATEEVDPNWVLSIMRAENADFDPSLVSSAGAIGLMQVMPRIGKAFGANDLTDPEQNIRAGTRFLRVLVDKYRNPVLGAAAYNAGEPNVDLHHSLPLIRETADYVTRVVGYYIGMTSGKAPLLVSRSSTAVPGSERRTGSAERARSPMLVFSVANPPPSAVRPHQEEANIGAGGPVKIVKEEVLE